MKHVTLAYAVAVLALAGSAAAQETPQTGAPVEWAGSMLDPQVFTFVQAERLEGRTSGGEKGYLLDLQGWVGTDTSKFWGKAEAEGIVRLTLRPAQCRDEHSPAPLPSASLSARNHQPCRLALPQILHELPGC